MAAPFDYVSEVDGVPVNDWDHNRSGIIVAILCEREHSVPYPNAKIVIDSTFVVSSVEEAQNVSRQVLQALKDTLAPYGCVIKNKDICHLAFSGPVCFALVDKATYYARPDMANALEKQRRLR